MTAAAEQARAYCPTCERQARITEHFAFGGRSRVNMTLGCGHVVPRPNANS